MSILDNPHFPLGPKDQENLLSGQHECALIWSTREGWPVGAMMAYSWQDGKIWMTCGGGRPRVGAIRRNDRVSVIVSEQRPNGQSAGVTLKGRCRVHNDRQTKDWYFDLVSRMAFPDNEPARQGMLKLFDAPDRVVLSVTPVASFSYDGAKMMQALASAVQSRS